MWEYSRLNISNTVMSKRKVYMSLKLNEINSDICCYDVLPPFQIIRHFGFSRYIVFAMHLDVVKSMYLGKPKRLIIWNGESIINNFISLFI